jgi:hypothetical protein
MINLTFASALAALPTACVNPENVRAAPEDTWTWQVNRNYQQFAQCVTDALNGAPVQSWFYQAPRPITSFDQQWQRRRIILRSIDPWGIEQVRIEINSIDAHDTRVAANAKNLEALGGGSSMVYVRGYVDICARS